MKIAVTGKGGVGKTTFAATLARLYAEEGRHVLAADVDPDANLGLALGFTEEELDTIVPISKMRKLVEERTGASPDNKFYRINPKVDDIPDAYGKVCNGVKLLVLGTVETGGGGCVCPEHVMLKRIINNLVLHRGDVVILDMEAGLEHLGRGTTEGSDRLTHADVSPVFLHKKVHNVILYRIPAPRARASPSVRPNQTKAAALFSAAAFE